MSRGVTSAQQRRWVWVWVGLQKPEGAPALPKHLHTVMNNQSIVVVTLFSSKLEPLLILTFLPMIINQCQYASLDAQDSRPTRGIRPITGLLVFISLEDKEIGGKRYVYFPCWQIQPSAGEPFNAQRGSSRKMLALKGWTWTFHQSVCVAYPYPNFTTSSSLPKFVKLFAFKSLG